MTKKETNKSNSQQLQNPSLSFIVKNSSLFSATSVLSFSPMAYNTTAFSDKFTCLNLWTLENVKTDLDEFFGPKKDSNYLDVKIKVFKIDDNKNFRLVQNLTIREADVNHFMRLRNQLAVATENFGREENLPLMLSPTKSIDMDQQLKLMMKV